MGPTCRERDVDIAFLVARICVPSSKLATLSRFADTTLGHDLPRATSVGPDVPAPGSESGETGLV